MSRRWLSTTRKFLEHTSIGLLEWNRFNLSRFRQLSCFLGSNPIAAKWNFMAINEQLTTELGLATTETAQNVRHHMLENKWISKRKRANHFLEVDQAVKAGLVALMDESEVF